MQPRGGSCLNFQLQICELNKLLCFTNSVCVWENSSQRNLWICYFDFITQIPFTRMYRTKNQRGARKVCFFYETKQVKEINESHVSHMWSCPWEALGLTAKMNWSEDTRSLQCQESNPCLSSLCQNSRTATSCFDDMQPFSETLVTYLKNQNKSTQCQDLIYIFCGNPSSNLSSNVIYSQNSGSSFLLLSL